MRWRTVRWVIRILVVVALLYGVWLVASYFVGKHYFTQGMRCLADDPAAAARSFGVAVRLQPRNAQYRAALGRAYLKQKDYVSAANHLEKAANRDPDNFGLWQDLGDTCLKANSPVAATKAFQKALEIRPDAQQSLSGLAEAAVLADDWEAALPPLRKLWAQGQSDLETGRKLAQALVSTGHNDETLKVCKAAKARIAKQLSGVGATDERWQMGCPFLLAEGDAYRAKGRWTEAISAYLRCSAINPEDDGAGAGLRSVPESAAKPVAIPEGAVSGPSFAPDSRHLAFYLVSATDQALCVLDALRTQPREIIRARPAAYTVAPAWSPDGTRICYSDEDELRIVNVDGSGNRKLVRQPAKLPQLQKLGLSDKPGATDTHFPLQHSPAWCPDGKRIAYAAAGSEDGMLTVVVDVASGKAASVHQTTGALPKFAGEYAPHWSADGRVICGPLAYVPAAAGDEGQPPRSRCGLTIWSAAGEVKRQLSLSDLAAPFSIEGDGSKMDALWAPDTRHVAVALPTKGAVHPTVSVAIVESSGKWERVITGKVAGSCSNPGSFARWLDPSHVRVIRRTGDTPLDMGTKAIVYDLKGSGQAAKDAFSLPLFGEWDLSRDGKWLALAAPGLAAKGGEVGLWLFNLEELRKGEG
jgi:tetratricopeptide (TPR) repeat protein